MKEERNIITMDGQGNISLPSDIGATAMTEREICELFGVIAPTVRAGIKALCKSGVLSVYDIKRIIRISDKYSAEVYNLETIAALAFRVESFGAAKVRKVLLERIIHGRKEKKARKPKKEKKIKQPKIKTKKEKPKRREEIIRISPLAIILMITVIALLVGGIYIGSNVFSYNSNIKEATNSYIDNDYTKAYNLLAGMKLKDKDKDFYKQVENIMKVEKHINDFNSFITIEKYTYALEALIRGIESYDENIEASKELGTYEILETEMNEIDTLLKNYFGMSIEDARTIIQITDSGKYAKEINERAAKINIVAEE